MIQVVSFLLLSHSPTAEGVDVSGWGSCFHAHFVPPLTHLSPSRAPNHLQHLFLFFFLFKVSPLFPWMTLSRCSTSSDSSSAPPHLLGTSSLLKLSARHRDLHCGFRRAGSKTHATRKNLILCAATATVDMSLKADSEPNNSVSIEEEVSLRDQSSGSDPVLVPAQPGFGSSLRSENKW